VVLVKHHLVYSVDDRISAVKGCMKIAEGKEWPYMSADSVQLLIFIRL